MNQQDNNEKKIQVGHMREIYAKADMVIAWLGLEADEGISVMEALKEGRNAQLYLNLALCFDIITYLILVEKSLACAGIHGCPNEMVVVSLWVIMRNGTNDIRWTDRRSPLSEQAVILRSRSGVQRSAIMALLVHHDV